MRVFYNENDYRLLNIACQGRAEVNLAVTVCSRKGTLDGCHLLVQRCSMFSVLFAIFNLSQNDYLKKVCIITKKKITVPWVSWKLAILFFQSCCFCFHEHLSGISSHEVARPRSCRWFPSCDSCRQENSPKEQSESFFSRSWHLRAARQQACALCLAPSCSYYTTSQACRMALALCLWLCHTCGCGTQTEDGWSFGKGVWFGKNHQNCSHKPSGSS